MIGGIPPGIAANVGDFFAAGTEHSLSGPRKPEFNVECPITFELNQGPGLQQRIWTPLACHYHEAQALEAATNGLAPREAS